MPASKILACLSLDQDRLFKYLQLNNGTKNVTKITAEEKKMLKYVLIKTEATRFDVPCKKIFNLRS